MPFTTRDAFRCNSCGGGGEMFLISLTPDLS
jgi:hypothetical protein